MDEATPTQCINPKRCDKLSASLKQNKLECIECGEDISQLNRVTRLLDDLIDDLIGRVDQNDMQKNAQLIIEAVTKYCEQMRPGHIGKVSPAEAGLALQIRSLHIIKDLQKAISEHG